MLVTSMDFFNTLKQCGDYDHDVAAAVLAADDGNKVSAQFVCFKM